MTIESSPPHTAGEPPDGITVADVYRVAVEEYRWQAAYNWSRVQYLLALNVAVLAAGVALAARSDLLALPVFALGLVAAVIGILVQRVQHAYYRRARDRMRTIEETLTPEYRTDTTAGLAGTSRRISVTQFVHLLLGAIAAANVVAAGMVLAGH